MFALLLFAALAASQGPAQTGQDGPPQRIRSVLLYGDQTCPETQDADEIVVCARVADSPYRIPKRFRAQPSDAPGAKSWAVRAEVVEEVNRAGLPNSCSPIGMGGQSGCTRAFIRQWAQERVDKEAREASVP